MEIKDNCLVGCKEVGHHIFCDNFETTFLSESVICEESTLKNKLANIIAYHKLLVFSASPAVKYKKETFIRYLVNTFELTFNEVSRLMLLTEIEIEEIINIKNFPTLERWLTPDYDLMIKRIDEIKQQKFVY